MIFPISLATTGKDLLVLRCNSVLSAKYFGYFLFIKRNRGYFFLGEQIEMLWLKSMNRDP